MEVAKKRDIPASHTSYSSSYRSHGSRHGYHQYSVPSSQRRTLRSVKENSALLRSPGPLTSMLKTTTETGDIGLFSITPKTTRSQYSRSSRPRPLHDDLVPYIGSHPRNVQGMRPCDDRLRLPSLHRDTTSEIISLYGSETQNSAFSRSYSSMPDSGQRSYSMTTCSSRYIPSQTSLSTFQSRPSRGVSQRVRSPFSSSTRFKQPRMSPHSLTTTERGTTDDNMVADLDRVSHPQSHGSYGRRSYHHGTRKPPQISMQSEWDRSATFIPSQSSPIPFPIQYPYLGGTRSPKPCHRRPRESSGHSLQSAGLTSIVDMYQRPDHRKRGRSFFRAPVISYYDYSENFNAASPGEPNPAAPLCPIPRRARSLGKPMVLREESQASLDAATDLPQDSDSEAAQLSEALDHCKQTGAHQPKDINRDPPQLDRQRINRWGLEVNEHGDGPPTLPLRNSFSVVYTNHATVTALEEARANCQSAPPTQTTKGYAPADDEPEYTDGKSSQSRSRGVDRSSQTMGETQGPSTPRLSGSKFHPQVTVHDHGFLSANETEMSYSSDRTSRLEEGNLRSLQREGTLRPLENNSELQSSQGFRKRHRRNQAAIYLDAEVCYRTPDSFSRAVETGQSTSFVFPSPPSIAPQLRAIQSIPQLMKPLPPLPVEEIPTLSVSPLGDYEKAEEALADRHVDYDKPGYREERNEAISTKVGCTEEQFTETQSSPSKFKVRVRGRHSQQHLDPNPGQPKSHDVSVINGDDNNATTTPKLKLKLSRARMGQTWVSEYDTIIRSPWMKKRNSQTKLRLSMSKDLFNSNVDLGEILTPLKNEALACETGPETSDTKCLGHMPDPSPRGSGQLDLPCPPARDEANLNAQVSGSTVHRQVIRRPATDRRSASTGRRGLRQKLSLLRLRVTGNKAEVCDSSGNSIMLLNNYRSTPPPTLREHDENSKLGVSAHHEEQATKTRPGRINSRMKRWAQGAKRMVRSYVKRTLVRSMGSSE